MQTVQIEFLLELVWDHVRREGELQLIVRYERHGCKEHPSVSSVRVEARRAHHVTVLGPAGRLRWWRYPRTDAMLGRQVSLKAVQSSRAALYAAPRAYSRTLHTGATQPRGHRALWYAGAAAVAAGAVGLALARPAVQLEAPAEPSVGAEVERMIDEPTTRIQMPATMTPVADDTMPEGTKPAQLRLVGIGLRKVTFIGIYVYVMGLYVEEEALAAAHRSLSLSVPDASSVNLEQQLLDWLNSGTTCAIRIMPVRQTDLPHLRDGLVRAVSVRSKTARTNPEAAGSVLEGDAERTLDKDLTTFKGFFPRSQIQRGSPLDLVVRRQPRTDLYTLSLQFKGRSLGTITSTLAYDAERRRSFIMPIELLVAYVGEKPDISAPVGGREHGCTAHLAVPPVGTAGPVCRATVESIGPLRSFSLCTRLRYSL